MASGTKSQLRPRTIVRTERFQPGGGMRFPTHIAPLVPILLILGAAPALAADGVRVPLFARQTNRMCSACHLNAHYIELTEMGRTFKLNAYRLTKVDSLGSGDIQENTAAGR